MPVEKVYKGKESSRTRPLKERDQKHEEKEPATS